jgi:hypothetical protein
MRPPAHRQLRLLARRIEDYVHERVLGIGEE